MANIKVKAGWEDKEYTGIVGGKRFKKVPLGKMSEADLQSILDSDPRNASRMIDGTPSKAQKADNKPGEPLPEKPKA